MSNLVVPALVGVGAVLLLDDDAPPPAQPRPVNLPSSSSPATAGNVKAQFGLTVKRVNANIGTRVNPFTSRGSGAYSNPAEAAAKKALEDAHKKAKAEYDKLSAAAKKAGAAKLSEELGIKPPLTGNESWEQVGKIAGGAAGGAACGAIPGAQAAAPLCAMAGAYLGKKLSVLIGEQWDKVDDWIEDKWDDAADAVTDAVGDAYDTIKGWF